MPSAARRRICSTAIDVATRWPTSGSSSRSWRRLSSQGGTLAPQRAAKRRRREKFPTGMMPGTIGVVMPAERARSRKRRNTSVSKQNWVMARFAPASILAFRWSRSAWADAAFGWTSG